jgi:outer membrane murein-binding lipoprotein Lpp
MMFSLKWFVAAIVSNVIFSSFASAQPQSAPADSSTVDARIDHLSREVDELKALVHQLQSQLAAQAGTAPRAAGGPAAPPGAGNAPAVAAGTGSAAAPTAAGNAATPAGGAAPASSGVTPASSGAVGDLLHGMTVNALLDGYYEYNTNDPIGRVNELRAYDVSSNRQSCERASAGGLPRYLPSLRHLRVSARSGAYR